MNVLGASLSQFGDGNVLQIWNVQCNSSEISLANCSYQQLQDPRSSINYSRTTGVRCYSKITLIYCTDINNDIHFFQTLQTVLKEISD